MADSSNLFVQMQEPLNDQFLMSHEKVKVNQTLRIMARNLQRGVAALPKGIKYEAGPALNNAMRELIDTCIDAYTADSMGEQVDKLKQAIQKTRYLGNRLRTAYDCHFFPEAFFKFHFDLCESVLCQLKNWRNTLCQRMLAAQANFYPEQSMVFPLAGAV